DQLTARCGHVNFFPVHITAEPGSRQPTQYESHQAFWQATAAVNHLYPFGPDEAAQVTDGPDVASQRTPPAGSPGSQCQRRTHQPQIVFGVEPSLLRVFAGSDQEPLTRKAAINLV